MKKSTRTFWIWMSEISLMKQLEISYSFTSLKISLTIIGIPVKNCDTVIKSVLSIELYWLTLVRISVFFSKISVISNEIITYFQLFHWFKFSVKFFKFFVFLMICMSCNEAGRLTLFKIYLSYYDIINLVLLLHNFRTGSLHCNNRGKWQGELPFCGKWLDRYLIINNNWLALLPASLR